MAYSYEQTVAAAAATVSITPTNVGDLLIWIADTTAGAGNPTVTVADNNSVAFTQAVGAFSNGGGDWLSVYYLPNCEAGITSVTGTFNGGTPGTVNAWVIEYSGIASSSSLIGTPIDSTQVSPGTGANALTVGPLNVTSDPALVLGLFVDTGGNSMSAGTGYTQRYNSGSGGANLMIEDLRATSAGNQTPVATASIGTHTFTNFVLAFGEAIPGTVPGSGSASLSANAPGLISGTVLTPLVARQRSPCMPSREILVPSRKIILPPWRRPAVNAARAGA